MSRVTKKMVLESLEKDWDGFAGRLQNLPAGELRDYLTRQGYQTASDLLAHIAGWWKECMKNVALLRKDPAYHPPKVDVDEFNRNVVEENRGNSEEQTIRVFHAVRAEIVNAVRELPDDIVDIESINDYLYWCVTNHFAEHAVG